MGLLEALILGIIQGLTEFLPVSSSGHIELGKEILNVQVKDPLLFSIVVHGATALSTLVIFRKDILSILKELLAFKWNEGTKYSAKILLSMIPVGLVGFFLEDEIKSFFEGQILLVGYMLLITGILLFLTTRAKEKLGGITFKTAGIVGIAQAIAILPGISRSGSTIATSLLLGVNREKAAKFSFLMVLPPILGAVALKVKDYMEMEQAQSTESISSMALTIGFIAAFISGLFACKWMIRIVKRAKLQHFAYYCFTVGTLAIIWKLMI